MRRTQHNMVSYQTSKRRRNNIIKGQIDSKGLWSDHDEEMEEITIEYFHDLFSTDNLQMEEPNNILDVIQTKVSSI